MFKRHTNKSIPNFRVPGDSVTGGGVSGISRKTTLKSKDQNVSNFSQMTFGTLRGKEKDKAIDTIRRPYGSLGARRTSDHEGVRGTTKAILLTGGLEVTREGFLLVRSDGLVSPWKKRYVIFEDGLVKIFDPVVLKNANMKTKKKQSSIDEYAEEMLNVVELKDIIYEKRKGKAFDLVFRQTDADNRKSQKTRSTRSTRTKSLGSPTPFAQSIANALRPWRNETIVHFKAATGNESDDWVQSILYEVKNQAQFIDRTIRMLEHRSPNEVDKIDTMYRQSVDLWAIAKGKISKEALAAVENFHDFLERNLDEEASYWLDAVNLIKDLLEQINDITKLNGLEELQRLNEEEYHKCDRVGMFKSTLHNFRKSFGISTPSVDEEKPLRKQPKLGRKIIKRTFSDDQKNAIDEGFKSALDMREQKEFEEDKRALERVSSKRPPKDSDNNLLEHKVL